jgi:hypothetical protein
MMLFCFLFSVNLQELLDEGISSMEPPTSKPNKTLDERKLEYVKPASGVEPQTPTSVRFSALLVHTRSSPQLTSAIPIYLPTSSSHAPSPASSPNPDTATMRRTARSSSSRSRRSGDGWSWTSTHPRRVG